MSRKVVFPSAAPVTVLLDPADDAAVTRAALAAHCLPAGHITVHPAPAVHHQALAFDILAALGKPAELPGDWGKRGPSGLEHHRSMAPSAACDPARRAARPPAGRRVLVEPAHPARAHWRAPGRRLPHPTPASRDAHRAAPYRAPHRVHRGPDGSPAGQGPHDRTPTPSTEGRWITVPALAYLDFPQDFPACDCTPPPAARPYVPERAYALGQIAHRLATRTASPQLAAALATATFTGAPISQLRTIHYSHLDQDATTLTLHDRYGTRRHGFATNCGTYTVPPWARPFLLAAANLLHLSPRSDGFLLNPPRALPHLTDFAEHCRLRPPQPTSPRPRQRAKREASTPTEVQWYDGYLRPSFEAVSYQHWLRSDG
ncbi:hypothetical protein OG511_42530 [Streptomyces sp. NBC_01453]|uniref:hypothetical protein n=1 Tax=Streptomyces sp. NBC_01453 TaxID=2903873 RepID=UPI002E2B4625|nr:hypothetical protein [Streptomyces sp. NBC_01453]